MLIRVLRYNTYLLLPILLVCLAGCQSTERKQKRQVTVLRVHVEVFADSIGLNKPVSIFRANPMTVSLKPDPFLTEAQVLGAKVIEDPAGFSLQIKFDRRGTQLLESVTASNPGRHLAIFCEFGEKLDKVRWLAAPVISRRISNGLLVFTPDADREEAEQVALGLNNVARETQPGLPDEK
jgi:preprotein translocase subunit SecD